VATPRLIADHSGFNERWTNVLFGKVERTVAASLGDPSAQTSQDDEDEKE